MPAVRRSSPTVLGDAERRRVQELASTLLPHRLDGPPVLSQVVDELRRLTGAQLGMSTVSAAIPGGFALASAHLSGSHPGTGFVPDIDAWMHRSPARFALYDPTRPEPAQRNRVINVGRYLTLLEHEAESRPLRPFGVRKTDFALARERLAFALELAGVAWLVRRHQLRALICDGERLLAWVGVVDSGPFGPREEALLAALIPTLHKRLTFERRLQDAAAATHGLTATLEALAGPAFLFDSNGQVREANALGRAWFNRDRKGLLALVAAALQGAENGFRVTPVEADGVPAGFLGLWEHRTPEVVVREARFARAFKLTAREQEIFGHVVRGGSNKEIATVLGCGLKTVEGHVTRLLKKLQSRHRSELTARFWLDRLGPLRELSAPARSAPRAAAPHSAPPAAAHPRR
jgi:DNA-binding CsgD family transcriptional regulator